MKRNCPTIYFVGSVRQLVLLLFVWVLLATRAAAEPLEELLPTNQPGQMVTKQGQVDYARPSTPAVLAQPQQWLDFGDALRTRELSRATVRFFDWSQLRMKELTRLEILRQRDRTNAPGINLHEGQLFFSSRGKPQGIPIETPHAHGTPYGTEFLVAVDVQAGRTEVTMLDGEVELTNDVESRRVHSGQQGVAQPGRRIEVRSVLEAMNIVQWWIYYPGILDPSELSLDASSQSQLAESLAAYQAGDLPQALEKFPGYPAPADPEMDEQRTYLAALFLAVGAADRSERQLSRCNQNLPLVNALQTMLDAVRNPLGKSDPQARSSPGPDPAPSTASQLIALSYLHQSTNGLRAALEAARAAVKRSPRFGFAWARIAELEFSFGRTRAAQEAVTQALQATPRNAQAHALQGFLLAAENRIPAALTAFEEAIRLDPALANGWLGRGLCRIRDSGLFRHIPRSALEDLQVAAILEPNRSLLRSYSGKAFTDAGDDRLAAKELTYATKLDPKDPTPWLYSALEKWQENRVNEAVDDLEHSVELNDNRAVFRSRLMLDQDLAVRSASLARIYQSAGLDQVSLSEAAKAVSCDYANYSAHQFLAESFDALRDPARFNLRYETPWFNELLLANILSPVGAGVLSQNISQQEYSRLFAANQLNVFNSTEARSDGQVREVASESGLLGRFAYSLDFDYQHNNGVRPNNDLDRFEWYGQFKQQLSDRDSAFLLLKCMTYDAGDNFQYYDPGYASRTFRITETQTPIALAAIHREWEPGIHTTLLAGRLQSDVTQSGETAAFDLWTNSPPPGINWVRVQPFDYLHAHTSFTAGIAELNQVFQSEQQVTILGGRFQAGSIETANLIDASSSPFVAAYYGTPVLTSINDTFQRWSLYGYHTHEIWRGLRLTAGLSYDSIEYPANFRFPPVIEGSASRNLLSPKAALEWQLHPRLSLRAMYAQSLGGLAYDESVRLEPTQLVGFSQAFRSVISEAEAGSVVAPKYQVGGLALDWKLPTRTFLGVQAQIITSDVDQSVGVFRSDGNLPPPPRAVPSSTAERLSYEECSLGIWANQLLGTEWSLGASYWLTDSRLNWFYPEIPPDLPLSPNRNERALLQVVQTRLQYQHHSGFFARADASWYIQHNQGYGDSIYSAPRPDDSVSQLDLLAGWRFLRRRAEVAVGCLNVTDHDYRLNPLTPYFDMPRGRTWTLSVKLQF